MTSHRDSHTITDVKPEIIPGVQTGNGMPHDKYNICGIDHVCTNRKDDIFRQRGLYIDKSHMGGQSSHPLSSIFRKLAGGKIGSYLDCVN